MSGLCSFSKDLHSVTVTAAAGPARGAASTEFKFFAVICRGWQASDDPIRLLSYELSSQTGTAVSFLHSTLATPPMARAGQQESNKHHGYESDCTLVCSHRNHRCLQPISQHFEHTIFNLAPVQFPPQHSCFSQRAT